MHADAQGASGPGVRVTWAHLIRTPGPATAAATVRLGVDEATHELRVVHVGPPTDDGRRIEDRRQPPALLVADRAAPLAPVTADGA